MKYRFIYSIKKDIIARDNEIFIKKLSEEKTKLDNYSKKWNKIKKMIHDYEYIYTSPNTKKNISSIIPISRSYYKLKEIISDYNMIDEKKDLNIFCMAEAPGGFIQCLLENKHNIDKLYATTLYSTNKDIPDWATSIKKNKDIDFLWGVNKDGDLYNIKNILSYIKIIGKNKIDIITSDGGLDSSDDYNKQEINSLSLIYSEIFLSLNLQKKGGIFICKLFDIFLKETIKLFYILTISYEKVYIHKPKISRLSNSEKYIVCIGYKGNNTELLNSLFHSFETKDLDIKIDSNFEKELNKYNNLYTEIQIEQINKGIQLMDQNKIINYPTKIQKNNAIEWCNKYNIRINFLCYYLNETFPN
jgi:23S rRNA U2552 (ribose-2'-O)-methylase RlmE/FtsJ